MSLLTTLLVMCLIPGNVANKSIKIEFFIDGDREFIQDEISRNLEYLDVKLLSPFGQNLEYDFYSTERIFYSNGPVANKNSTTIVTDANSCYLASQLRKVYSKLRFDVHVVGRGALLECEDTQNLSHDNPSQHNPSQHISAALVSILEILPERTIVIFYDDFYGLNIIRRLVQKLSGLGLKVSSLYINHIIHSQHEIDKMINSLGRRSSVAGGSESRRLFLTLSKWSKFLNLLDKVKHSLLKQKHKWIVTQTIFDAESISRLFDDFPSEIQRNSNIVIMVNHASIDGNEYFKVNRSLSLTVKEKIYNFLQPLKTIISKSLSSDSISEKNQIPHKNKENLIFDLVSTYTDPFNRNITSLRQVAVWSERYGLNKSNDNSNIFLNKFTQFYNQTLIIGAREALPFNIKVKDLDFPYVQYKGFCFDILDELAARLNFSYKVVEPPDKKYGAPIGNGSWNGMVGMVLNGEVDMAIGPFTITSIREEVIDFPHPILQDGVSFIVKRPDEPNKMFKMFRPFGVDVWISICFTVVLAGVLQYVINKYSPVHGYGQGVGDSDITTMTLDESCWMAYSMVLERGADFIPNATSGRIVVVFWWFFAIVIMAMYTADLAAYLAVPVIPTPVKTLKDIADQNKIKPLVKDGTSLYSLFQEATTGVYRNLWEMMADKMPKVTEVQDAIDLVYNTGKYAFLTDVSQLEYIVNTQCEKYVMGQEVFNTAGLGFVLPQDVPYLESVSDLIRKMQESGVMMRWKKKWWEISDAKCSVEDTSDQENLSMDVEGVGGAFIVLASATCIAIIILICEICYRSFSKNKVRPLSSGADKITDQKSEINVPLALI